jgi:hypothetical protein
MKHESESFQPFKRELPTVSGNLFRRALLARGIASLRRAAVAEVVAEKWPADRTLLQMVTRGAVLPAMTGVAGWAAELAVRKTADTLEALGADSGAAEVLQAALVLDWDGAGVIGAPGFVASANNSSFVAEGAAIPVRQLVGAPADLLPYKLATIAVLTRQMADSGNAEVLIGDTLVRSTALALDAVFFGSAAASAAQPAGIRNGIAALTPSNSTVLNEAFSADFAALLNAVGAVGGNGPFALVANAGRIGLLSTYYQRQSAPNLMLVASSAVGADVIAIAPKAIAAALSADPDVETASTATLVMDTAPGAAGTMGPEREMFQTDSIALKVRWPVSWVLRDSRAVAWLTPTWR